MFHSAVASHCSDAGGQRANQRTLAGGFFGTTRREFVGREMGRAEESRGTKTARIAVRGIQNLGTDSIVFTEMDTLERKRAKLLRRASTADRDPQLAASDV